MLEEYITYDQEFLNTAITTIMKNQYLGIDNKGVLLEKNSQILEKIIKLYQEETIFKDYQVIHPKILKAREVLELANSIFISLLPNFEQKIISYDDLLYTYPDFSFQKSCYCYDISDDNKVIPVEVQISDTMTEYIVGIINHEKMHALVMDSIPLKRFPGIYFELLSMLIQKITNYRVEQELKINTTHLIDEVVRINDNMEHIFVLDSLGKVDLDQESINNLFVYQYLNLKANDYLLSDWYSDLLFQNYLLDPEKIKKELNQVFSLEISIKKFLSMNRITLRNSMLLSTIQEKIEDSKKYSLVL